MTPPPSCVGVGPKYARCAICDRAAAGGPWVGSEESETRGTERGALYADVWACGPAHREEALVLLALRKKEGGPKYVVQQLYGPKYVVQQPYDPLSKQFINAVDDAVKRYR